MVDNLILLHSILRYACLVLLPLSAAFSLYLWKQEKAYTKFHEIIARLNIAVFHGQMMVGIILMTHSSKVSYGNDLWQNSELQKWSIFHPLLMFMSIVMVTLALMVVRKKEESSTKHRLGFVFYSLGFAFLTVGLILIRQ